jgi:D-alanyl-lipoteichoic acid acyltransferase DltB (MBOAT superfamily)
MLFNSYEFLFLFLPLTLAGFFLLGRASRHLALAWLVAASLGFYAWWRPLNVLIIAPSILINYAIARALLRRQQATEGSRGAKWLLAAGVIFNVLFLGYFKYTNFLAEVVADLSGADFVLGRIILPLGISFITFQKIAFLVDVHAGRVTAFTFREYLLFVLFFPQLIAGPIVHFRELMPQFERARCRFHAEDVAVGLTLLGLGLFKKVVLADGIAPYVTPTYEAAAAGAPVALIAGWVAAVGFTLQIYFDFSGYSDMALGLGRCFGVKLPANFDSPLKASSIIDFWARWHITLTRFLAAYLYNPLVLWLNRRRMARGLPGIAGRRTRFGAFVDVLVGPTLLTMAVSGLWHGAGYTFILWGVLHGVYLSINHAWRLYGPSEEPATAVTRALAWSGRFVVTFAAVIVGMVLFRASTLPSAGIVLAGMLGLNGVGLPIAVVERLEPFTALLPALGSAPQNVPLTEFAAAISWVVGLLVIALCCPNSLEITGRFEPALDVSRPASGLGKWLPSWRPSLGWALVVAVLAAVVVMRIGPDSEFLYWQF